MNICTQRMPEWGVTLIMPLDMAQSSMDDILLLTNGCGRAGIESRLVPDTILGLDVSPACRVHDWMYMLAENEPTQDAATDAEEFADAVLAANVVGIVCQKSRNKLMRWLRLQVAHCYIDATSMTDVVHPAMRADIGADHV